MYPFFFANELERANQPSMDFGPHPTVVNLSQAARHNPHYRNALWTGEHLQVTLMCIPMGGEVGLEVHPDHDQILVIEQGMGLVKMGRHKEKPDTMQLVFQGDAVIAPQNTWHNLTNVGQEPLKLYSIYGPAQHPWGTIQRS